ncbi:hypothetical protein GJAV_G00209080 [Gymnothorax javanicus]|nr:hypothetical protein GJAV_G00209080 [Gymnothorax javanicus]
MGHKVLKDLAGGGKGTSEPTPLDTKIASILGTASVCGIVSEKEGDRDLAETTEETVTLELEAMGDEEVPGTAWLKAWLSPAPVRPERMARLKVAVS